MTNKFLRKVKIFFTGLIAIWIVIIVIITQNDIVHRQVSLVSRGANSLIYRAEFNQRREEFDFSSASALLGIFRQPERVVASGPAVAAPALVYHGLINTPDRFSTTPGHFKEQMFALKRAGYETVKLADFIAFVKGERELPERSFLLTFDDGRADSFENADPVLKALGWSAVMFIATGQSLNDGSVSPYYLSDHQLREMEESGRWEIESHAVQTEGGYIPVGANGDEGNFLSNFMWLENEQRFESEEEYRTRVMNEFSLSRLAINEALGKTPRAFAYPFSDYGHQTINAEGISEDAVRQAVSANYEVAFQQTWADDNYFTFNYIDEDLYRLRRIETPTLWRGEELLAYIIKTEPKILPYTDSLTTDSGWKTPWGNISFDQTGLQLSSSDETNGASAFLDGTRAWRDYHYFVRAGRGRSNYLTLYARYQSNDNYVSCTFGENIVKIDERVEGTTRTVATAPYNSPSVPVDYSIRVEGGQIECRDRGTIALREDGLNPKISTGGIGFRVWNEENLGISTIHLSNLSVKNISELETALSFVK